MRIRRAAAAERRFLCDLATRARRGARDFAGGDGIAATGLVYLIEDGNRLAGFYALAAGEAADGDCELRFLWTDSAEADAAPALWRHAVSTARAMGFSSLIVQAAPGAAAAARFFTTMGAERVSGGAGGARGARGGSDGRAARAPVFRYPLRPERE